MWPSGRSRLGGATTDENLYGNAAAAHTTPTLHKPAAGAAAAPGGGLGSGAKAAARKALGSLGNNNVLEDQARIKQQGLLGLGGNGPGGKDGSATRPRRALGEITNRVAPPAAKAAGAPTSSLAGGPPTKPAAASKSGGIKGGNVKPAAPLPGAVAAAELADLPSFSDDEEEVEEVELPAGRLGEEEDRLVAKRRAQKEAAEDAGFLRTLDRLLCARGAAADDDDDDEEEDEEELGMEDAVPPVAASSAMDDDGDVPPPAPPADVASLGAVLDDLDLMVDF